MNKAKRFAIAISALSLAGTVSIGLAASTCGTTISSTTSDCLSQAATTSFIKIYGTYLAGQGGSTGNSYSSKPPQSNYSPPQNKTATNPTTKSQSKKQNINWF